MGFILDPEESGDSLMLSIFSPYSDDAPPSLRRLLVAAAPWTLVGLSALYALFLRS